MRSLLLLREPGHQFQHTLHMKTRAFYRELTKTTDVVSILSIRSIVIIFGLKLYTKFYTTNQNDGREVTSI